MLNMLSERLGEYMSEVRYMISEASKLIEIEQHTLRYWEEELELNIPRNEMGHRYYRREDIELIKAIKILKDKGYQLRAIKILIPEIQMKNHSAPEDMNQLQKDWEENFIEEVSNNNMSSSASLNPMPINKEMDKVYGNNKIDKLDHFKMILKSMIREVLEDNNEVLAKTVNEEVAESVIKEMDYLLRIREEREEERFKKIDRTIREVQNAREEVATTRKYFRRKSKSKFFQK